MPKVLPNGETTPTLCFTDKERKLALIQMEQQGLIESPASTLRELIDILAEVYGIEIAGKTRIRRETIDPQTRAKIIQLYKSGMANREIEAATGVKAETVAQIKSRDIKAKKSK